MIVPTSDCRQLVPIRESNEILKVVLHHTSPVENVPAPGRDSLGGRRREARSEAPHIHQPTPAECYGCVEWFHY